MGSKETEAGNREVEAGICSKETKAANREVRDFKKETLKGKRYWTSQIISHMLEILFIFLHFSPKQKQLYSMHITWNSTVIGLKNILGNAVIAGKATT